MIIYRISIVLGSVYYCHEFTSLSETVENLIFLSGELQFIIRELPLLIAAAEHIHIMLDNDEVPDGIETIKFADICYVDVFYERCDY